MEIDTCDPMEARRCARVYLWLMGLAIAAFVVAVCLERAFNALPIGFVIPALLGRYYLLWSRAARCIADGRNAEIAACALAQKGMDFVRANEILRDKFPKTEETVAVMADPSTWGRKQRLFKFRDVDLEVILYEKDGRVGALKVYVR